MLHNNFAYLDFIVVQAPQVDVLRAVAAYQAELAVQKVPKKRIKFPKPEGSNRPPSLWSMIVFVAKQKMSAPKADTVGPEKTADTLFMHLEDAADLDRMITWSADDQDRSMPVEIRVSTIEPNPEWTLIEFADLVSGTSPTTLGLSAKLPEEDFFYFRRSGAETDAPHFDYHHYRAGEQRRRVMSHCTDPTDGQPAWQGCSEGPMLHFEDPKVYDTGDAATILTADKQADILARLGVPLGSLFDPDMRLDSILISDRPGGAPISALLG